MTIISIVMNVEIKQKYCILPIQIVYNEDVYEIVIDELNNVS